MVKIKRVHDPPLPDDGKRVLVDRLWPRGIKKTEAHVDEWLRDIAPSNELRAWYGHEPAKWQEFRKRYLRELRNNPKLIARLKEEEGKGTLTLLFAAKGVEHSNAAVLKELLDRNDAPSKEIRSMKNTMKAAALVLGMFVLFASPSAFAAKKAGHAELKPKAVHLKLSLRDLWIGHIFWVRNVVLETKAGNTEAAKVAEGKVVEDAKAIGDAIGSIYGKAAGDKLFGLLSGHYGAIKEYMNAAFAGNADAKSAAVDKIKANAEEIATFLSSANPNWPKNTLMRLLMAHGGHHIAQIDQINGKDFAAEATTWDDMKNNIYVIADALADGIVKQFPKKF